MNICVFVNAENGICEWNFINRWDNCVKFGTYFSVFQIALELNVSVMSKFQIIFFFWKIPISYNAVICFGEYIATFLQSIY